MDPTTQIGVCFALFGIGWAIGATAGGIINSVLGLGDALGRM